MDKEYNLTAWKNPWLEGRVDGHSEEYLRWHQVVKFDEEKLEKNSFAIIGFACDEGVSRNKGRVGAIFGPEMLRKFCTNLPATFQSNLVDVGDIACEDRNLEDAQERLALKVCDIQLKEAKSLVFGGGHELVFGHFSGLRKAYPTQKIGIINFDAHFDNRAIDPNIGATSGTGFWQIAENDANYSYMAIGIQRNSNTKVLFDTAKKNNTSYILADDYHKEHAKDQIADFMSNIDVLYVTVCLDVFAVPFAPGVSAPSYAGIIPDNYFRLLFKKVISNPKLRAFDIAELNPFYDIDNHTARLAAGLVFEALV